MTTKKTWKNLQHGDVIKQGDEKYIVVDVLPNSIFIQDNNSHDWIARSDLQRYGWQIVQPEEEAKEFYSQSLVDYKEAFLRLDAAILNLKLEREEIRTKYPHLFN